MELIIYIKVDLALNNLQRLICHKPQQTKPTITFSSLSYIFFFALSFFLSCYLSFFLIFPFLVLPSPFFFFISFYSFCLLIALVSSFFFLLHHHYSELFSRFFSFFQFLLCFWRFFPFLFFLLLLLLHLSSLFFFFPSGNICFNAYRKKKYMWERHCSLSSPLTQPEISDNVRKKPTLSVFSFYHVFRFPLMK